MLLTVHSRNFKHYNNYDTYFVSSTRFFFFFEITPPPLVIGKPHSSGKCRTVQEGKPHLSGEHGVVQEGIRACLLVYTSDRPWKNWTKQLHLPILFAEVTT